MATGMGDFTDILIRRGAISRDQLTEAERMARSGQQKVADCLIQLGYATGEEVMRALAEENACEYVDLQEVKIPDEVIELVPESVARENVILPLRVDDEMQAVIVVASDPQAYEVFENLRFILNKRVEIALAPRESILESINRYYGQVEGESADSMLQEFTDTAIDWLDERDRSRPFCALVQHKAPHEPWDFHERHAGHFDAGVPEPATLRDDYDGRATPAREATMRIVADMPEEDFKQFVPTDLDPDGLLRWKYQRYIQDYLRCVQALDENVARLLGYLDDDGVASETIVVYTSDQG
ncbi:MAG: sulfatase-like hydrolase/transferase, partial [Planctomycetes bacterium]|nr:sulfatase-like hydrolase/transferase [Planctomycetota bacterium]